MNTYFFALHSTQGGVPPTAIATAIMVAGALLISSASLAHSGNANLEARASCAEQTLGDACEWHDAHDALYVGSCRAVSNSLLCVRNKPIVYPEDHPGNTKH